MAFALAAGAGAALALAITASSADDPPPAPAPGADAGSEDAEAPEDSAGTVRIVRNVDMAFAPYITDSTPATEAFMRENYDRIRGFAPFQDQALEWGPPTLAYQDLYALYNASDAGERPDLETLEENPDWVLRDSDGNALYIPFDCEGGTCPQFAADPANPEWRRDWIERAISKLDRGYVGIFVDDVNTAMRVSDGNGDQVAPIDPRTGETMTLEAWRRYIADFTVFIEEELEAHDPDVEITHNPLWFEPQDDPSVRRANLAADTIQLERGFNDRGLVGGSDRFGYLTFLDHVDHLHSLGLPVLYKPDGFDEAGRDYELAGYFLVSEPGDSIAPESFINPDDYWPGWDVDLGEPEGRRYIWRDGLIRRDFERGFAVVNQPGAAPVELRLPEGHTDAAGEPLTELTLNERNGAVVIEP